VSYKTSLRTIRPGDPNFLVKDGSIMATRAGVEISNKCPSEYKELMNIAIINGWVSPLAVVRDAELVWDTLVQ